MRITVLDPAVENVNAGDEIISQAVQQLPGLGAGEVERLTTHRLLRQSERALISDSDVVVLSGTNALSSHMEKFRQWLVDPDLTRRLRGKLLLLGVGWWQYQDEPCAYTRWLFRTILTKETPHALRDDYTARRIAALGSPTLMTGCPTTWTVDATSMQLGRASSAVITVTDYKLAPEIDRAWISEVVAAYADVRAVGMGPGDHDYFASLGLSDVRWVGTGVSALEGAVADADFIGTRLHAGIRALQMGRPAVILAVDNRAHEIGRSSALTVVDRQDRVALSALLGSDLTLAPVQLPHDAIARWKEEFSALLRT